MERTINSILSYNLSNEETEALLMSWIINGCWGEGSFSFDEFTEKNIEVLWYFDIDKKVELLADLKRICYEHDIDFRFKKGFLKSNLIMVLKVRSILYWVTPMRKYLILGILFYSLCKYGYKFYG